MMESECPMAKRPKLDEVIILNFDNNVVYDNEDMQEADIDDCDDVYDTDDVDSMDEKNFALENKLRQFDVLDEVQGDDSGSDDTAGYQTSDSDIDDDELENLLDEGLPDDLRDRKKDVQYEERFKTVLEEKGHNHFEVLPEGWIKVTHNSGLPIYLHKTHRVCTVSKPYFLGPGSVRKHEIPITAIPCLNYKRAIEKEAQKLVANGSVIIVAENSNETEVSCTNGNANQSEIKINVIENGHINLADNTQYQCDETTALNESNSNFKEEIDTENNTESKSAEKCSESNLPKTAPLPGCFGAAKIETITENTKAQSLNSQQITDYCKSLFIFKKLRVMRFNSWSARRKFTKNKKNIKNLQRPVLPDGTKLITFPVLETSNNARAKKEWIMNPNGKSYVCILHEYVQHALKKQPVYEFKELENAATPYSATVSINDLKYGVGFGTSKKQAKSEAARETLEILIPEMRDKISSEKKAANKGLYKDLSVFDEIRIEDPRVNEFCTKTTEPSPHAILTTCLQRNYGLGDAKIEYHVNTTKNKRNEFTITVGKHKATVVCRNKKDGKQRASQAILQILHPHIKTWGSLLRLYGNHSVKSFKEKKQEEQEITILQSKAAINQPNYAILDKLKLEMNKLMEIRAAIQPIGKFVPPKEIDLPYASGSNLNNVEL